MEMHQIRYFLAASRTLNFTRAAEECHVAQPSLTRAIKLLEEELGGELFRRERNLTHLTDLGTRMLPMLQQCYDSALNAKSLATSIKRGGVASLTIAMSRTIGMELLIPHLRELIGAFSGLELKFVRGNRGEIGEVLKRGEADLAVAGALGEQWERLDAWPLFTEECGLLVARDHALANQTHIEPGQLKGERLILRRYCEDAEKLASALTSCGVSGPAGHQAADESDLVSLLAGKVGVAVGPRSAALASPLQYLRVAGLDHRRTVYAYAVAGRQRSAPTTALLKLLRAGDWSHAET